VDISGFKLFSKGKVRNVYDFGDRLLIVASDRISAFDFVLPTGIPDKGKILTAISAFWFKRLEHISPHHMISTDLRDFPDPAARHGDLLQGRSMLVRRAERIDVECIVRGYLAGSVWKEYQATGRVAGLRLPAGLGLNQRLESPIFTPSTKSDTGHDQNITLSKMNDLVGAERGQELARRSLALFEEARLVAEPMGITVVDTKFEFGRVGGQLMLIDEVLTPDSSRFLASEEGSSEPINLDKQLIRDYLDSTGWDRNPPPPELPPEIVTEARRRYLVILERLTGRRPPWAG
jgi:phosphoribosylaminoimidazole-succinocarboxamide synthase